MNDNDIKKALDWCEQFENNLVFIGDGSEKYALALQMMVVIKHALKNYNSQNAEIERLEELLSGAKQCIAEMEYAIDKVGFSNSRIDDALEEWNNLVKEMVGERE